MEAVEFVDKLDEREIEWGSEFDTISEFVRELNELPAVESLEIPTEELDGNERSDELFISIMDTATAKDVLDVMVLVASNHPDEVHYQDDDLTIRVWWD